MSMLYPTNHNGNENQKNCSSDNEKSWECAFSVESSSSAIQIIYLSLRFKVSVSVTTS